MSINLISGNILNANLVRGSNLAVSSSTAGANLIFFDMATGRVGIRTNSPGTALEVAGVLRVGNVEISNVGNITAGNVYINNLADPQQNQDAATKFYVDNQSGNALVGNITFSNTTISTSLATGNITLAPTGNSTVIIDTTSGLVLPVGNTAQRPSPAATGTIRWNTGLGRAEVYDGAGWEDLVANVTNQTFSGDGSNTVFALDRETTTAAALVAINGVVQLPVTAYTVTGNTITFAQPPTITDTIDVRFL